MSTTLCVSNFPNDSRIQPKSRSRPGSWVLCVRLRKRRSETIPVLLSSVGGVSKIVNNRPITLTSYVKGYLRPKKKKKKNLPPSQGSGPVFSDKWGIDSSWYFGRHRDSGVTWGSRLGRQAPRPPVDRDVPPIRREGTRLVLTPLPRPVPPTRPPGPSSTSSDVVGDLRNHQEFT